MSQMLKSTGAMGLATLASRVFGMLRETVYAGLMGDGPVAAAFKTALLLPNMFRRLLGEGALTAAFIPIFKDKEKREGEAEMWRSANAVISGLFLASCAIIIAIMLGITLFLHWDTGPALARQLNQSWPMLSHFLPGSVSSDARLMLQLTRVMFPYMLLVCMAAILMGMLNARGHFLVPAMGATIMNLVLISVALFVAPFVGKTLETQIFVLAGGVLLAGLAQAAYQLPTLRREGFRLKWVSPWKDETVRQVVRKMVPGMMGVAAFQVNVLLTAVIAWSYDPQIYASFDYAVRLMEFPQGIFGISLATYLLPTLSGLASDKKYPEFRGTYRQAMGYLLFGNLIAAALLCTLATPMIRLIFEHGKFTSLATDRAAFALSCLGPGLIAFSIVNITARAYYALGDTRTPMIISSVCLILNVVFALILIPLLAQGGMAIANTLSACFNVYFLLFGLRKKLSRLELGELRRPVSQMAGAALLAGALAWISSRAWEANFGHANLPMKVLAVFVPVSLAALVYFAVLSALKIPQARDFLGMVRSRVAKR